MPNDEEAAKAIAGLDGKEAGGRNLKVNEARPRARADLHAAPVDLAAGTNSGGGGGKGKGAGGGRGRFSNEDYSEAVRQPREPRW